MATRLAIREKQLETWTAIIQECRNSGSIHIEIDGGVAPAVIRSITEVLVDAE